MSRVVRLYRAALRLLPPDLREEREETVCTFAALWRDARGPRARARLLLRCFGALPALALIEWIEYAGAVRSPARPGRSRPTGLWRNLRYAGRTLARTPAFTVTAVLLVALGVGAVTTIFTVVDHVLLRPLPYPAAERLVYLEAGNHTGPFFHRIREATTLESAAATFVESVTLVGRGDPLRLRQASVSEDFFALYGARALHGRLSTDDDFARGDAVFLDGGAWRRIWGGDAGVVGQAIDVDGRLLTVAGVVDPAFSPPSAQVGDQVDLWRPADWTRDVFTAGDAHTLAVTARLAEGASPEAARAEVDALVAAFAAEEGNENYLRQEGGARSIPVTSLAEVTVGEVRRGLGLLAGAVGLLLLVACVNVAHLFLARGLGRTREMAVRRAMGAGTGSLVGQLLAESLLVGVLGGLAGAGAARLGVSTFLALYPDSLPRAASVAVDAPVLLFAALVSLLTALAFGLLPALRSVERHPAEELRGAGRSSSSGRGVALARSGLVAAEVALSLVLVVGAGLLLRSFLAVRAQPTGFETENVWTVPLSLTEVATPDEWRAVMEGVQAAALAVPGVRSATHGLTMPLEWTRGTCCWRMSVALDGEATPAPFFHPVGGAYFETLGIELVAGRAWTPDEAGAEPWRVVLSEPYAVEVFGSAAAAVGRTLEAGERRLEVVGVAADTRHFGLDREHGPALYLATEHIPFPAAEAHLAVKVEPEAAASMPRALREAVWSVAPRQPVPVVRPLEAWAAAANATRRFGSALSVSFAALALLLAAAGVYGTLTFVVGERRREMGIRLALGASRAQVEGTLVGGALRLAALGVLVGLAGAWAASRLLESLVWGVGGRDPLTLAGASLLMLVTALLAAWLPARRAGRLDPVDTLRAE